MLSPANYNIQPWTPTPAEAAYLAAVAATRQFLHNLPPEIIAQYGGQWIAAKDAAVIAAAPTRAELSALLAERDEDTVLKMRVEKGVNIRWRRPSSLIEATTSSLSAVAQAPALPRVAEYRIPQARPADPSASRY